MSNDPTEVNVQPSLDGQATVILPTLTSLNRRGWLKSALAASAAVAGVAALARAEAQEALPPSKDPAPPGPAKDPEQPADPAKAAEYGMLVKIGNIKGNVTLGAFKDCVAATHCSFSSAATRMGGAKGQAGPGKLAIEQSSVLVDILDGAWLAELQQSCYDAKPVGDVVISQLGQAVDTNASAEPTTLQKITLANAIVSSLQQNWDNGDGARSASISFSFDKILFEIGTKPADFTLRNITAKAV